jgi:hypothetical protein
MIIWSRSTLAEVSSSFTYFVLGWTGLLEFVVGLELGIAIYGAKKKGVELQEDCNEWRNLIREEVSSYVELAAKRTYLMAYVQQSQI